MVGTENRANPWTTRSPKILFLLLGLISQRLCKVSTRFLGSDTSYSDAQVCRVFYMWIITATWSKADSGQEWQRFPESCAGTGWGQEVPWSRLFGFQTCSSHSGPLTSWEVMSAGFTLCPRPVQGDCEIPTRMSVILFMRKPLGSSTNSIL